MWWDVRYRKGWHWLGTMKFQLVFLFHFSILCLNHIVTPISMRCCIPWVGLSRNSYLNHWSNEALHRRAQNTKFPEGLRCWCHQTANLSCQKECGAFLIEQVIPPRVDFKREVLAPAKSGHYASETFLGPFGYPFRMNLRPVKPYAVIKGIKWLKNNVSLIWEFLLCAGTHPEGPLARLYSYYPTSQLPRPIYKGRHCNVPHVYSQVTS
jgi:hypothetical protein